MADAPVDLHQHQASDTSPTLRVIRFADGAIQIDIDRNEWVLWSEVADLSTWLAPIVDVFIEHDAIASRIGQPLLPLERAASELAEICALLATQRSLVRLRCGRWRFTAGRMPGTPPANEWGEHAWLLRAAQGGKPS